MEPVTSDFDEFCSFEEGSNSRGRLSRSPHGVDETTKVYKSKNIDAERRRRKRISERLLMLRSLVPIITNMNKATIIDDAITYIEKMQKHVKELSDQLLEMESSSEEEATLKSINEIDSKEEMKSIKIEADVQVTSIDGEKLWIKIVLEKKTGAFTKLMEAMNFLGLEVTDTSVTASKGAILVTSCVEGINGGRPAVEQIREFLLDIIRSI